MNISCSNVSWIILNIHFSVLWKMTQQILHSRGKILLLPCCGFLMPKSSQFKWFKWFVFVLCIWPWNTFWRRWDLTKSRSYFHCNDFVERFKKFSLCQSYKLWQVWNERPKIMMAYSGHFPAFKKVCDTLKLFYKYIPQTSLRH